MFLLLWVCKYLTLIDLQIYVIDHQYNYTIRDYGNTSVIKCQLISYSSFRDFIRRIMSFVWKMVRTFILIPVRFLLLLPLSHSDKTPQDGPVIHLISSNAKDAQASEVLLPVEMGRYPVKSGTTVGGALQSIKGSECVVLS